MTPKPLERSTKPPMLHCRSKLDSQFSFKNEDTNESSTAIQPDAIHRAVGREPWFYVSPIVCLNKLISCMKR